MPSLNDLAAPDPTTIPGRVCSVCWLIAYGPDNIRELLPKALATTHRNNEIAAAEELRPYGIAANTIGRHRRGECAGTR